MGVHAMNEDYDDCELDEFDIEADEADTANDVICAFCELRPSITVISVRNRWLDVCEECRSGL